MKCGENETNVSPAHHSQQVWKHMLGTLLQNSQLHFSRTVIINRLIKKKKKKDRKIGQCDHLRHYHGIFQKLYEKTVRFLLKSSNNIHGFLFRQLQTSQKHQECFVCKITIKTATRRNTHGHSSVLCKLSLETLKMYPLDRPKIRKLFYRTEVSWRSQPVLLNENILC